MNAIKPLSFLLAMSVSGFAMADVTLNIPTTVDVLVANGEKPSLSGSLFASEKTLTLPDGENQLAFRIEQYFDKGNDRIIVESDVIIAKFNESGKELSFELPKYRNEVEAQENIKDAEWSLVDQSGSQVNVSEDKLIKKGMQIGRNYSQELMEYNRKGGVAAVAVAGYAATPAVTGTQPAAPVATSAPVSATTAEEMLHFWYSKADEQTKARFKAYVNSQ